MRELSTAIMIVISAVVLWDWQQSDLILLGAVALLAVPVGIGIIANEKTQAREIKFPRFASLTDDRVAELWRNVLFGIIACNWLLLMTAIVVCRENWFDVTAAFQPFINFAQLLLPALEDVPGYMRDNGYGSRGAIIQTVAAICIIFSLCFAFVFGYLRAAGLSKLNKEAVNVSIAFSVFGSVVFAGSPMSPCGCFFGQRAKRLERMCSSFRVL